MQHLPEGYFSMSSAIGVQVNMSKTDSMDSQWRAAASGYAAQVLHPQRSAPNAPLFGSHCSCSLVPSCHPILKHAVHVSARIAPFSLNSA